MDNKREEEVTTLDVNEVLYAYTQGFFPMAHEDENNQVYWHKPQSRGIIPLDQFHVPKNLSRLYRRNKFDLHRNKDFEGVIRACSNRSETWISEEIINTYVTLHNMGYCQSFETWLDGKLVGGLYGISMGRAFFGESMFHTVTDASKIALVFLVEYLKNANYTLLDTQYLNPHLEQFGAVEIPDDEYMKQLKMALSSDGNGESF
jgi:leucyl/phenylalanyl-tRNA--protein transferase